MPHLHLPLDHTDADLVLAANLADIVGSEDLYVAWTEDCGAGVPEIEAYVSEEPPPGGFVSELLASLAAAWLAAWRAFAGRPARALPESPAAGSAPRQIEPSA